MTLETQYLYLFLMLFCTSYPLAQSFEWRIKYYKKWNRLLPAILAMMLIFIPWDVWFTEHGIWWFNDKYITGWKLFSLPLEEWSFFIIVPFACIFIYEVLNFFVKKDLLGSSAKWVIVMYSFTLLVVGFINYDKTYTVLTFLLTGAVGLVSAYRNPKWLGRFLLMYLVSMLPFLLINGALTGSFTEEAVVNYNPEEFMGIRIFTVPVEDSVYAFLMLLMIVWVYEGRKNEY